MDKFKGIGKAAFVVGFTYAAGKFTFLTIADSGELLYKKFVKYGAQRGSVKFKAECDRLGVEYEEHKNDSEFQMGFHA